jgi:hypothetical protein
MGFFFTTAPHSDSTTWALRAATVAGPAAEAQAVGRLFMNERSFTAVIPMLALLASLGCVAFHEPLSESTTDIVVRPPALAKIHVLVRRPELQDSLPPEKKHWEGLAQNDILEFWMSNADHVIRTLSDSELFAGVSYAEQDQGDQGVLIRPVFPPPGPYCDGQSVMLPFMTLGLLPATCEIDRGIYFEFVGRQLPTFSCRWPQTQIVGWFPVLLATGFGSWTKDPIEGAFISHVRACLVSQSEAFSFGNDR